MNPLAPISHHWIDATHITYGVITTGVAAPRWKIEASLFNGREPDESRYDLDFAALDSYSARAWFLPTGRWSLQLSAGHLEEAEAGHDARVDVDRVTASATYHRALAGAGIVATTVAWGHNHESGVGTHALLAESSLVLSDAHVVFARGEVVQKTAHDLDLHAPVDDVHEVGKLQLGYSRFVPLPHGWRLGIGGSLSIGLVSDALASTYGARAPLGGGVFLTLRPAAMWMQGATGAPVAPVLPFHPAADSVFSSSLEARP